MLIISGLFKRDKPKLNKEDEDKFLKQKELREVERLSKLIKLENKRENLLFLQHERPLTLKELREKRQVEKDITDLH